MPRRIALTNVMTDQEIMRVVDFGRRRGTKRPATIQALVIFRLAHFGLRRGEIHALNLVDVAGPYIIVLGQKPEHQRSVYTSGNLDARADIIAWRRHRLESGADLRGPLIIVPSNGNRLQRDRISKMHDELLRGALGDDRAAQLSLTCGRHNYGVRLASRLSDRRAETIQQALGLETYLAAWRIVQLADAYNYRPGQGDRPELIEGDHDRPQGALFDTASAPLPPQLAGL